MSDERAAAKAREAVLAGAQYGTIAGLMLLAARSDARRQHADGLMSDADLAEVEAAIASCFEEIERGREELRANRGGKDLR